MNETIILDIFLDIKYDMYLKFKMKTFVALQEEIESHIFAIFKLFFPNNLWDKKIHEKKMINCLEQLGDKFIYIMVYEMKLKK